ncbi:MAG: hypothetical protein NUV67_02310, partial [archaeon]|nr:hypothetical protein [archaeon]
EVYFGEGQNRSRLGSAMLDVVKRNGWVEVRIENLQGTTIDLHGEKHGPERFGEFQKENGKWNEVIVNAIIRAAYDMRGHRAIDLVMLRDITTKEEYHRQFGTKYNSEKWQKAKQTMKSLYLKTARACGFDKYFKDEEAGYFVRKLP